MDEELPKVKSAAVTVIAVSLTGMTREAWDEAAWRSFVARAPAGSQLVFVDSERRVHRGAGDHASVSEPAAGLGDALRQAAQTATTPLVFIIPADKSLTPAAAADFLAHIDEAHLVAGCRRTGTIPFPVLCRDLVASLLSIVFLGYFPGQRPGWPGWRGWSRRWVARHLFGVSLLDPESNVLLARRQIFDRIPLQSAGTFTFVELVAKANHLGMRLAEVGVDGQSYDSESFWSDVKNVFRNPKFVAKSTADAS